VRTPPALPSRLEVLPFASAEPQLETLAAGTSIAVTVSPKHGVDHTLDFAEPWVARGLDVVPHIAARMVADPGHADRVAERIRGAGFREVFVIGGDQTPPLGPYDSAGSLLERLTPLLPGVRVGIAGYPEGHPIVPDDVLTDALAAKSPVASAIVTQLCFDSTTIVDWVREIREAGIRVPVLVGIPGVVDRRKLLELATRVGVGASTRYLRKNLKASAKLLLHSTYEPASLVDELQRAAVDPSLAIAGFHVFTFNQVTSTLPTLHPCPLPWKNERIRAPTTPPDDHRMGAKEPQDADPRSAPGKPPWQGTLSRR